MTKPLRSRIGEWTITGLILAAVAGVLLYLLYLFVAYDSCPQDYVCDEDPGYENPYEFLGPP